MNPLAIEIQNLRKTFGNHTVLGGISLSAQPAQRN